MYIRCTAKVFDPTDSRDTLPNGRADSELLKKVSSSLSFYARAGIRRTLMMLVNVVDDGNACNNMI